MFEKEAKEYRESITQRLFNEDDVESAWEKGAEFGYNKAKEEMQAQTEKMKWHKMDYKDKESCKKIPRYIQLLTEYDCGLFVAYCVNRWTGNHWEEHSYGITRWKDIEGYKRK